MTTPEVSFVVLTYKRPRHLLRCLESLERAGAAGRAEVCVAFNGPQDEASLRRLIEKRYPWARALALPRSCRGGARNRAVPLTRGKVVYFLDDDTTVPPGFVDSVLGAFARHPGACVIGGPNVGPARASAFQRAVDFLLRSPLGAGPMRVRYQRRAPERPRPGWSFTLSSLGMRREVFERHRLRFPEGCASAEENLFLFQAERKLGPAVFSPGLYVHHSRRGGLVSFCRQVASSGKGRLQISLAAPDSLQSAVLAPAAALLYALAWPLLPGAWRLPGIFYAAACLAEGLRLAFVEGDLPAAWRLPLLFPLAHLSYVWGGLDGLIDETFDAGPVVLRRLGATDG